MEEEENSEHNLLWHLELREVMYNYECTAAAVIDYPCKVLCC